MGIGVGAALIASAVIGAGSSAYQANEQKKIAEEQQRKLEEEKRNQALEAERLARLTQPEQQTAGKDVKFGLQGHNTQLGSASDFLVPKATDTSGLGVSQSKKSGLGFAI